MAEGMLKEFFLPKHEAKRKRFVKEFSMHIIPMANPWSISWTLVY